VKHFDLRSVETGDANVAIQDKVEEIEKLEWECCCKVWLSWLAR